MSGWAISTHNLPWIKSYDEAEKYFKSRPAWPKQDPNWKPLDSKRMVHKRLVFGEENQSYMCVLYDMAVVTYYPDGKVKLGCYNSTSTQTFAYCMAPEGMGVTSLRGRMYWRVGDQYFRTDHRMSFQKKGDDWAYLDGAATDTKLVVDRKKSAAVRKTLKPLLDWLTVHERISGRRNFDAVGYSYADDAMSEYLNNPSSDLFVDVINNVGGRNKIIEVAYKLMDVTKVEQVPLGTLPPKR